MTLYKQASVCLAGSFIELYEFISGEMIPGKVPLSGRERGGMDYRKQEDFLDGGSLFLSHAVAVPT